jgi:integrase/recombinase XerD
MGEAFRLEDRGVKHSNLKTGAPMTSKTSPEAISRLRARMIEDMTIRGFAAKTQVDYVRCVKRFAAFLGRAPDTATPEEIRRFQFALREDGMSPFAINAIVSALRFFFKVTLGRPDIDRWTQFVREPSRLPVILAQEEVARLIDCAPGPVLKYKAVLSVAYGAGLRVSEVAALKISDIDSERMLIHIEQAKGKKDRYVMLSPSLLELLRDWWREARPVFWMFPGRTPGQHITSRQINRAVHAAADLAGIDKKVTPHTLRHSFATHLLEGDIDVRIIQALLGHSKLDMTAHYTRVATTTIRNVMSPLDRITLKKATKT